MQDGGNMYREKIENLKELVQKSEHKYKENFFNNIQKLINSAATYVETVVNMESSIKILSFRLEGKDYRLAVEALDKRRRAAHNALIAQVKIANRICELFSQEPIYDGNGERDDIARFAFDLVNEFRPKKE